MPTETVRSAPRSQRALQCMEIWSGNASAERVLSTPGLDAFVYSRPYRQSSHGGDVHYVSLCGGGIVTRLLLADVSGHGEAVSDLARSLRELMRRNINRKSQDRLVRQLNRQFAAMESMGRFATAVAATYLADRRELTICNAGHPRPLHRSAGSNQWDFIDAVEDRCGGALENLPLGVDDSTVYPQTALRLAPGDMVLFYTDALTETPDLEGRLLGEAGLKDLLADFQGESAEAMGRFLLERIAKRQGSRASTDDLTILLLYHSAEGPMSRSLRTRLNVYAKIFGLRSI